MHPAHRSIPQAVTRSGFAKGTPAESCLACAWRGEVSGARRFQIPLEGKEVLPSAHGNMRWPDPVEMFGAAWLDVESWTPLLEPSRRGNSEELAERNEIDCNDYDVQKPDAKVAVEGA